MLRLVFRSRSIGLVTKIAVRRLTTDNGSPPMREREVFSSIVNRWRQRGILLLIVVTFAALPRPFAASGDSPGEYQIKAAFVYNFAKFVEWPSNAFSDSGSPIVIGVVGDDPFGSSLDQVIKGKTANGRRLVIKRFPKIRDIQSCHILFISSSESSRLKKTLEAVKGSSVLTTSDIERFAQRGGIVGLTLDGSKIGIDINVDAAKRANLKVSSKLLKLARIVKD